MKTIGEFLKDGREAKSLSLTYLERKTKIKKDFIQAIEEENWHKLPEFPVVVGFVKNIASALDRDVPQAVAFLKRDYPPQKEGENAKLPVKERFSWTPKLTFFAGLVAVSLLVVSYLSIQYFNFVKPPTLAVYTPREGEVVKVGSTEVSGKTDSQATLVVNNQPVIVSDDGKFETQIEVAKETTEIRVSATSRSGKVSTLSRTIRVEE